MTNAQTVAAQLEALIAEMEAGLEGVQGGPYKLDARACYIYAPSAKGGDFPIGDRIGRDEDGIPVMRLRGWGYYTGKGHGALGLEPAEAEAIQRRTGEHLARCYPANIRTLLTAFEASESTVERLTRELEQAREALKEARGVLSDYIAAAGGKDEADRLMFERFDVAIGLEPPHGK